MKNLLNHLVQKLVRPFSRSDSFQDETYIVVAVQNIIDQTIPRIGDLLSKHQIALRVQIEPADLSLECKEETIRQALFHMLKNSCESVASLEERWIEIYATEHTDCIEFSIIDSSPNTRFVFTMPTYRLRQLVA